MGDTTGACVEVGFMGYAKSEQKGEGIHTRLWSRAFVIEDIKGEVQTEAMEQGDKRQNFNV